MKRFLVKALIGAILGGTVGEVGSAAGWPTWLWVTACFVLGVVVGALPIGRSTR
jgi:ABC-type xylose transport system permease subunit